MVDLAAKSLPPISSGGDIQIGSPIVMTNSSQSQIITLSPDQGYGTFFTGTIINNSTSSSLTITFLDSVPSGPVSITINAGQAMSFNNWRCSTITVDASDVYVLTGRVYSPSTDAEMNSLASHSSIFFRVATSSGSGAIVPVYNNSATSYSITTNSTPKSTGLGVTLSSITKSNVAIWANAGFAISGSSSSTGLTATIGMVLYRSTTGIPSQGSDPNSGDTIILEYDRDTNPAYEIQIAAFSSGISLWVEIPMTYLDTGLTTGTTYYYYLAVNADFSAGGSGASATVTFEGPGSGSVSSQQNSSIMAQNV